MNLVIYTSLPVVGGHTVVSLKLVEMFRERFRHIWIGAKAMPGHGISADAVANLRKMGCTVREISGSNGSMNPLSLIRWLLELPTGRETIFLCVGMRYLPPIFPVLLRPRQSIYYHITHDLNAETLLRLDLYLKVFTDLAFVCPSTYHAYAKQRESTRELAWVTQASACEDYVDVEPKRSQGPVFRFGFSSRLNEAKGSRLLIEFAEECQEECELHIIGDGEFRGEFQRLANRVGAPVKVVNHGPYLPSDRGKILKEVFETLDCMCVPSMDDLEGFPTVALEAMQVGVPVLATANGGLASYRLEECGQPDVEIVELVEYSRFIARMERRIGEPVSANRRSKCRKYWSDYYSDARIKERWESIFDLKRIGSERLGAVEESEQPDPLTANKALKQERLILFTSLPIVGGHTTITTSLISLLVTSYHKIVVIAKEMPHHGVSTDAVKLLGEQGIEVCEMRIGIRGYIELARLMVRMFINDRSKYATVFLAMGMRHLSPLLAVILRPRRSVFYHITHELTAGIRWSLWLYGLFFDQLAFISPATADDYWRKRGARAQSAWVAQPTELHVEGCRKGAPANTVRFGFVGRLNEAKGSEVMMRFAVTCATQCELHVAGRGEYESEFETLSTSSEYAVKVLYHGGYAPSERATFLGSLFELLDYLIVPSQDDREGLPTVILEALQFGVPVVCTDSGGSKAFAMDHMEVPPRVISVITKHDVIDTLTCLANSARPSAEERGACKDYYREHFSDVVLREQWDALLDCGTNAS